MQLNLKEKKASVENNNAVLWTINNQSGKGLAESGISLSPKVHSSGIAQKQRAGRERAPRTQNNVNTKFVCQIEFAILENVRAERDFCIVHVYTLFAQPAKWKWKHFCSRSKIYNNILNNAILNVVGAVLRLEIVSRSVCVPYFLSELLLF
jgi:hypothetical protein